MKYNKSKTDFEIYDKISNYTNFVRSNLLNLIPAVDRDIRIHMVDEMYNLAGNMFRAAFNKGNIRIKHLVEMQINIALLDMSTNYIRSLKNIKNLKASKDKVDISIRMLGSIKGMVYAWRINEENKKVAS